jgi:hypothetical protein
LRVAFGERNANIDQARLSATEEKNSSATQLSFFDRDTSDAVVGFPDYFAGRLSEQDLEFVPNVASEDETTRSTAAAWRYEDRVFR